MYLNILGGVHYIDHFYWSFIGILGYNIIIKLTITIHGKKTLVFL